MARVRVTHPGGGRLMTKQAEASETDINTIVRRHISQRVPFPADGNASYGDFSEGSDFHAMLNRVREAEHTFAMLPVEVREYCANDPGRFLDLVYDPERREELVKLGLVDAAVPAAAKPPVEPAPVEPAPAPEA